MGVSLFPVGTASLHAEPEQGDTDLASEPKPKSAQKVQRVRVIPIGARRQAKFVRSKKPVTLTVDGGKGKTIVGSIEKGLPTEVMGKENEYVPYELYIANRNKKTGAKYKKFSLGLNSLTPSSKIRSRGVVSFFKKRATQNQDGKTTYRYSSYHKTKVNPDASDVLVTLVKNIKSKEGWADPLVRSFDVSPQVFPANSCLVYNTSPFPIYLKIAGKEVVKVSPYRHVYLKGLKSDKYGAIPYAVTMKVSGKNERVCMNAFQGSKDSRYYMFTFLDPRKGVKKRGDITVFTEQTPKPVPVAQ